MSELKPCLCGETPERLSVTGAGQGGKWANASGNCCGEWSIEFRTGYNPVESDECYRLAVESWNRSPRNTRPAPPDAELVNQMQNLMNSLGAVEACGDGMSNLEKECYQVLDEAIATLTAKPGGVEADPTPMLIDDNKAMRLAGDNLAAAALRVTHDYDGIHRLNLAISEWTKAVADEGGRGERYDKALSGEGEG